MMFQMTPIWLHKCGPSFFVNRDFDTIQSLFLETTSYKYLCLQVIIMPTDWHVF